MLKYKNFFPFFWSGTVNFFELVFVFGKNAVFFEFAVADKKNFRFFWKITKKTSYINM